MLNALSVDLEEWYHPELVRGHVMPGEARPQIEAAARPILRLLDRYGVRATFFIVGEVAQSAPELVHEIAEAGHEIGCHGMSHRPLEALQADELRAELRRYAGLMASLSVDDIVGFRAPTFSLNNDTRWAVPILREFSYQYDSSIFPLRNYMYGVADCPPTPYLLGDSDVTRPDPQGALWEFPMSVYRLGRWKMPVCGGFYLRALPFVVIRALLQRINARGWPFVIYLHPWETYSGTPRLRKLPWVSQAVTYSNIGGALGKLERLLQAFSFAPLRQVLADWKAHS